MTSYIHVPLALLLLVLAKSVSALMEQRLATMRDHRRKAVPEWPWHKTGVDTAHLQHALLDRFIVVPEHNLLFCYIEKVASTNFNALFKRVRAKYDPAQADGDIWFRNTPAEHNLTMYDLERILMNSTWHKAVFYREPLERFTSAFLSKCTGIDEAAKLQCKGQFGKHTLSFPEAVHKIAEFDAQGKSEDVSFDVHFKRMVDFCGGLGSTLQHYNTIEQLDIAKANRQVTALLKKVGVSVDDVVGGFDDLFPPAESAGEGPVAGHDPRTNKRITDAGDQMADLFDGDDAKDFVNILSKHYAPDYETFGIHVPVASDLTLQQRSWPLMGFHGPWFTEGQAA